MQRTTEKYSRNYHNNRPVRHSNINQKQRSEVETDEVAAEAVGGSAKGRDIALSRG